MEEELLLELKKHQELTKKMFEENDDLQTYQDNVTNFKLVLIETMSTQKMNLKDAFFHNVMLITDMLDAVEEDKKNVVLNLMNSAVYELYLEQSKDLYYGKKY